jgi:hypothetical protein
VACTGVSRPARASRLPISNDPNKPGWRIDVPFGIDPIGSPLGVRFERRVLELLDAQPVPSGSSTNAQIFNIDGDLKLRLGQATMFDQGIPVLARWGGGTYKRLQGCRPRRSQDGRIQAR